MASEGEESEIDHVEKLIKEIDKAHNEIEQNEEGKIPKEQKAIKEDLQEFKNGDLSEERMRRILNEMTQEEQGQEYIIQEEGQTIKETKEALNEIEDVIQTIKGKHNNEMKTIKGVEDALGSIANAENFRSGAKQAVGQIWNTVEEMETDVDEEAELSTDLDILSKEIGKTVQEEEELMQEEQQQYQLEQMADKLFAKAGSEEGERKDEELAEKDQEEYQETEQELQETERMTQLEEKEIRQLISELKESKREAERLRNDIQKAMSKIKGSPAEDYGRMRKLTQADRTLKENIQQVKEALAKLRTTRNRVNSIESEEKKAE
ncbi:MAG: hypothetical protein ABEK04_00885 [Candidatus Nanohalobium sp.]